MTGNGHCCTVLFLFSAGRQHAFCVISEKRLGLAGCARCAGSPSLLLSSFFFPTCHACPMGYMLLCFLSSFPPKEKAFPPSHAGGRQAPLPHCTFLFSSLSLFFTNNKLIIGIMLENGKCNSWFPENTCLTWIPDSSPSLPPSV